MTSEAENNTGRRGSAWTIALWGVAALILLTPLVAMQFTDEVDWNAFDFVVMGAILATACGTVELAVRMTRNAAYRAAVGVAVAGAFLLVWINLAVGIIGSEDNPANLMFGGVIAVGFIGAVIARFHPHGMARAMVVTAIAQGLVAVVAVVVGSGAGAILSGFFVALWLISARLFGNAARDQSAVASAATISPR